MTRTHHHRHRRTDSKEYWKGRLGYGGDIPGRETKVRTHRKERRWARFLARLLRREVRDD